MRNPSLHFIFFVVLVVCTFLACTSQPTARIPEEKVMHFPNAMALYGDSLLVASSVADGKYDFGRLVHIDTKAIKTIVDGGGEKEPIDWTAVVKDNFLVPQDIGQINYGTASIALTSLENNQFIAISSTFSDLQCKDPYKEIKDCQKVRVLNLPANDPFAVMNLAGQPGEEYFLVSYLSSDRLDVVELKKDFSDIQIKKSFYSLDWLTKKLPQKTFKKRRLIAKKIQVSFKNDLSRSKAYVLIEEHPEKSKNVFRPKATYLVALKVADLLSDNPIAEGMVDVWDFNESFAIASAQDMHIDDALGHLYLLGRIPEGLFKIDLATKALMEKSVVCTGARSMAVSSSNRTLIVPCYVDNHIALYSQNPLSLVTTHRGGRNPAYCVSDDAHGLIYCTYNQDGTMVIYDEKLNYRGYLFNKAPENRIGS